MDPVTQAIRDDFHIHLWVQEIIDRICIRSLNPLTSQLFYRRLKCIDAGVNVLLV